MGTNTGGSERNQKNESGQPNQAGSSVLDEGKTVRRIGKRKLTPEQHDEWRDKTKKKMKRSPRTTLRDELPEVLVSVLEEAHEGSCQHAKFLLEYVGTDSLPDKKEANQDRRLTDLLLENLGQPGFGRKKPDGRRKQSKVEGQNAEEKDAGECACATNRS